MSVRFAGAQAVELRNPETQEIGVWIDQATARAAIECLEVQPLQAQRIRLLEEAVSDAGAAIGAHEVAARMASAQIESLEGALSASEQARKEENAWWKSGWFGFAVGVVATGALVSVVALSL